MPKCDLYKVVLELDVHMTSRMSNAEHLYLISGSDVFLHISQITSY